MNNKPFTVPTRPGMYVKATNGAYLRKQLCQTPERGNELMVADILRCDPFQHLDQLNRRLWRSVCRMKGWH